VEDAQNQGIVTSIETSTNKMTKGEECHPTNHTFQSRPTTVFAQHKLRPVIGGDPSLLKGLRKF